MDISLLRNRMFQFKNLLKAIATIEKNNTSPAADPEIVKIGRGICLLLTAVFLAWLSKTETENKTRTSILQGEWPNTQVIHSVLKQGGWLPAEQGEYTTLLKNHPDPFSEVSTLWETEDHCLIYLNLPKPELWFCAAGHNKPKSKIKWHKIGGGYAAINQLSLISVQLPKKTVSYIDPKEIRY